MNGSMMIASKYRLLLVDLMLQVREIHENDPKLPFLSASITERQHLQKIQFNSNLVWAWPPVNFAKSHPVPETPEGGRRMHVLTGMVCRWQICHPNFRISLGVVVREIISRGRARLFVFLVLPFWLQVWHFSFVGFLQQVEAS